MSELEFLRRVGIFGSLHEGELEVVRGYLREMTCGHADAVFQQGDVGRDLYIVREGRVIVRVRTSDGTEVDLASFGPGDFFGEMSIFEDEPRSATCAMPEGGSLYRMSKDDLFALMADHPRTAIRIMYAMVSITTGVPMPLARSCFRVSMPFMPGILTSSRMRSAGSSRARRTPSSPEPTAATTWTPRLCSSSSMPLRTSA